MGKETLNPKLKEVVAQDYPAASEILLSFPDQWELVHVLKGKETTSPIYIGAFPPSEERPSRDHFYGLGPEINLSLTQYRLYKFFQPWVMPTVLVNWDTRRGQGEVSGYGDTKINMQPLGQAQVWYGKDTGILWECYFSDSRRTLPGWKETLADVWQSVERDIAVGKMFTAPHEPAFEEGYKDFLTGIGYARDQEHPVWWSKIIS